MSYSILPSVEKPLTEFDRANQANQVREWDMNSETVKLEMMRTFICNPDTCRRITLSDIEQYEIRPTYEATPLPTGGTLIKMFSGVGARVSREMLNEYPQLGTEIIN